MATPNCSVASTSTGPVEFGSTWRRSTRSQLDPPVCAASTYVLWRTRSTSERMIRAQPAMPASPTARPTLNDAEAEHGDQRQRQQQAGDRQQDVDEAHQRVVDPAADEPGDEPDQRRRRPGRRPTASSAVPQRQRRCRAPCGRTGRDRAGRCRTGATTTATAAWPSCSSPAGRPTSTARGRGRDRDQRQPDGGEHQTGTADGVEHRRDRATPAALGRRRRRPGAASRLATAEIGRRCRDRASSHAHAVTTFGVRAAPGRSRGSSTG